jgi:hypothetical protein
MVPGAGAMASESGGVRSPRCPPCRDGSAPRAARPARKIRKVPETIKAQVQDVVLTWAFASERVTGIEPALSAWESVRFQLVCGLTCGSGCPRVTVRDRSSPGLMAR